MKRNGLNGHAIALRSNVPAPARTLYPFARMKVGQSFHVPPGKLGSVRAVASLRNQKLKGGAKFLVAKEPKGDGFGCWRVK